MGVFNNFGLHTMVNPGNVDPCRVAPYAINTHKIGSKAMRGAIKNLNRLSFEVVRIGVLPDLGRGPKGG